MRWRELKGVEHHLHHLAQHGTLPMHMNLAMFISCCLKHLNVNLGSFSPFHPMASCFRYKWDFGGCQLDIYCYEARAFQHVIALGELPGTNLIV